MSAETIFFSYSRDDSKFVLNLAKNLRVAGANIWLDQLDIKPGARWDKSIEKALEGSNTLLVILSKSSVDSHNVMDEVSYALEERKSVVPVLLEECDIPFRLRRLQYADFSQDHKHGINTLISALGLDHNIASKLASVTALDKEIEGKGSNDQAKEITKHPEPPKKEPEKKEEPKKAPEPPKKEVVLEAPIVTQPKEKKSKSKLPIIIVVVLLAIAAVLFVFKDDIFKDEDKIAWDLANKGNTIEDYQLYINDFPNGKFKGMAEDSVTVKTTRLNEGLDESSWKTAQELNSIEGYNDYINLNIPIHKYVEDATERRDALANDLQGREDDDNAWNEAVTANTFEGFLAYYTNTEVLGSHRGDCIDKLTELGKDGWIYVGRSDGTTFTSEQLAQVVYRHDATDLAEDAFPVKGDIVQATFSEGSRGTYTTSTNRNNRNGSWNKSGQAYVLDTYIEGSNALILHILYAK